jgi:hypothetical protein
MQTGFIVSIYNHEEVDPHTPSLEVASSSYIFVKPFNCLSKVIRCVLVSASQLPNIKLILMPSFKLLFIYLMSENADWIHSSYVTMRKWFLIPPPVLPKMITNKKEEGSCY